MANINKRENFTYHVTPFIDGEGDAIRIMAQAGVAFVSVDASYDDNTAFIHSLSTEPAHRQKGLGDTMMDLAESAAKDCGCTSARLHVYTDAPKWLLDWYGRKGYKKVKADDQVITMQKIF